MGSYESSGPKRHMIVVTHGELSFFESRDNLVKSRNHVKPQSQETRRRMARERRGAESSVVSMETLYYKII